MQLSQIGRANNNARSNEFYGQWNIAYASGRSGLTALDGKISKFMVSKNGTYENECNTATLGLIPGATQAMVMFCVCCTKAAVLISRGSICSGVQ
jgi:hypothetical protein